MQLVPRAHSQDCRVWPPLAGFGCAGSLSTNRFRLRRRCSRPHNPAGLTKALRRPLRSVHVARHRRRGARRSVRQGIHGGRWRGQAAPPAAQPRTERHRTRQIDASPLRTHRHHLLTLFSTSHLEIRPPWITGRHFSSRRAHAHAHTHTHTHTHIHARTHSANAHSSGLRERLPANANLPALDTIGRLPLTCALVPRVRPAH